MKRPIAVVLDIVKADSASITTLKLARAMARGNAPGLHLLLDMK